jgi:excisionase family DNA binding protein
VARQLTPDEVAARLDRNRALIYRWLREGRIRGQKIGTGRRSIWLIAETELARFRKAEPERRVRDGALNRRTARARKGRSK